jgi:uncharacterized membrane protein
MHAEFLLLRLIHILSAITWVGGGIYATFFLVPAISSSPAVMAQVVGSLQRRRAFRALEIAAGLTILSGLRLIWIDSAGFSASYWDTPMGNTLGMAATLAIIAAVLYFGFAQPSRVRAVNMAASLAASTDESERARLTQERDRLSRRGTIFSVASVILGILAASGMAIARYA